MNRLLSLVLCVLSSTLPVLLAAQTMPLKSDTAWHPVDIRVLVTYDDNLCVAYMILTIRLPSPHRCGTATRSGKTTTHGSFSTLTATSDISTRLPCAKVPSFSRSSRGSNSDTSSRCNGSVKDSRGWFARRFSFLPFPPGFEAENAGPRFCKSWEPRTVPNFPVL